MPGSDGEIEDEARLQYHRAHILSVADAIASGANVRSYHAWSLYDNFEWASGYRPRFGLVHIDFATQRRTLKTSGHWYREVCHAGRSARHSDAASNGHTTHNGGSPTRSSERGSELR
jgi:beta-glucosidase